MRSLSQLILVLMLIYLAAPLIVVVGGEAGGVSVKWARYINPTDRRDDAYGTCVFGDYVAVVGEVGYNFPDLSVGRPYVALLRRSDGRVVKEVIGNRLGGLYNCISIGGKLYIVGYTYAGVSYGYIYVFDANLNTLKEVSGRESSEYRSLTYDGRALYVGGSIREDLNGDGDPEKVWLVEKRDLDTLGLVESREIYFGSWREGWINDIGVEPSTGMIWAVGCHDGHSLIVILDKDLEILKVIDYPEGGEGYLGPLYGVAFDGKQYVYVWGDKGVAKFSLDGELIAVNRDVRFARKIVYSNGYLYAFGESYSEGYERHTLYVLGANISVVERRVLSEIMSTSSQFNSIGRATLEGDDIYVAGIDYALAKAITTAVFGNAKIVIYSPTSNTRFVVYSISTVGSTSSVKGWITVPALIQLAVIGAALTIIVVAVLILRKKEINKRHKYLL